MRKQMQLTIRQMDVWILIFSIALIMVGVFFIANFSYAALQINPTEEFPPNRAAMQAVFSLVGLLGAFIASRIDYHVIVKIGILSYCLCSFVTILLCILRFFHIPQVFSISLNALSNPIISSVCLILAGQIAAPRPRKTSLTSRNFAMFLRSDALYIAVVFVTFALFCILHSVSGMLAFFALLTLSMFLSGKNHAVWVGVFIALCALILLLITKFDPHASIVEAWKNPWVDPEGSGREPIQIMYAIATGGLFGVGIGQGWLQAGLANGLVRYPLVGILHETGLVGTVAVLMLYAALLYRMVHIALHAKDRLGFALAAILAARMMVLVAPNVMASAAVIPTLSHLYLPFLSYGGSDLIIECFLMGIVLSVSRQRGAAIEVS